MKICIIYHSYSGITRGCAKSIQAACGGDLVEVTPREKYGTLTAYTKGCLRARNEEIEPIDPETIDVAPYDLLVIGTPVWAWKATPATNAGIEALDGCAGKKAVIFATCGSQPGDTLLIMEKALTGKGVTVLAEVVLTRKNLENQTAGLVATVKEAMLPS
jgi:flavodoxin